MYLTAKEIERSGGLEIGVEAIPALW